MKIESVRIENYRVFSDVTVHLNDYSCFVGPNGAGKSTVINALNVFFRERGTSSDSVEILKEEDFHRRNTASPVRITVTFSDLSDEAQEDFKHYYRQGRLVVSAEAKWNESNAQAEVKQYGQRMGMDAFRSFFSAYDSNAKKTDLEKSYKEMHEIYSDLPKAGTKEQMADALRAYEASHPDDCNLIPSEDQFYGVSRGANRLEKYVQWVYVPAVKDAISEQVEARNTALGKLLARTVRARTNFTEDLKKLREETIQKYERILEENQGALAELSQSLAERLTEWAHPDVSLGLQWQKDPQKSVNINEPLAGIVAGEGGFKGPLSTFGHGLQRSYLLTLLQELAQCDLEESPSLILACEEPELYQHPPQIRHLSSVFQRLTEHHNQIIVCTHSPWFVSGEGFENVRMVRKNRMDGSASMVRTGHMGDRKYRAHR